MNTVNTVVFSDVHLGSPMSRAFDLLQTLKEYHFKKLVILGDMFEDLNFKYLTSTHWELLEHIGKISRRGVEVVWIEGNHDGKFCEFISLLLGIGVHKEYIWEVGGRRFIGLHVHQFVSFLTNIKFIGRVFAMVYASLQRTISSYFFDSLMNKFSDRWLRLTDQIAQKAIENAQRKKCDVAVCGHTHFVYNIKRGNVEYFNTGCWNNKPSYLLIIEDSGKAYYKVVA